MSPNMGNGAGHVHDITKEITLKETKYHALKGTKSL